MDKSKAKGKDKLFIWKSIDLGYGESACKDDMVINLNKNRVVPWFLELQPVDVVDQIDAVMGTRGIEGPVDDDPWFFIRQGYPDRYFQLMRPQS